ncbi:MAG: DUF2723 domain-containing protein [Bacteroidota bacterium]
MTAHRVAGAVGIIAFAVYLLTLAPGVGFIDSGELAAVTATLGIAHPTGYPLFTLLGWLVAHVPLPAAVIVRLNAMAAAFTAAGAATFTLVFRRVLLLSASRKRDDREIMIAAGGGALLLAFSETFWSQAVAVEVYSLHILLVSLVLLAFLRANVPLAGETARESHWYMFAFLAGLSFTNHMTTVMLALGLIVHYFMQQRSTAAAWNRIVRMSIPFLAGLSLYLYLPIRAAQHPLLSWGDPDTLERFLRHVTGRQYSIWLFSSAGAAERQLGYFLRSLPAEFAYAGLVAAAAGFVLLWKSNRPLALGTAFLWGGCVAYAVNYNIHDIDSYFLLAYIVTGMWAALGLAALCRIIAARGKRIVVAAAVVLAVVIAPLALHYREVDRSNDHLVDDYTANMFASLDSNAVVFSYQWDYWVSASYYYQLVEHVRTDVAVIDKELLRRSWYLRELERRVPWLIQSSRSEVQAFLRDVAPFEEGRPYNGDVIERSYAAMIMAFIRTSMGVRAVYVTGEIEPAYTAGYVRVPSGLAFRLRSEGRFFPSPSPEFRYRPIPKEGEMEARIRRLYADALASRGEYYLAAAGDTLEARKALKNAINFDPSTITGRRLLARLQGAH